MQSNSEIFYKPLNTQSAIFDYLYEQLVVFDFNIIRPENKIHFENAFSNYLSIIHQHKDTYSNEINILFKRTEHFFMYVRNTVKGKGQKLQFYIMIYYYYCLFEERCSIFLHKHLTNDYFGSYCDFKYLCNYIYEKTLDKHHPLISLLVKIHVSLLLKYEQNRFLTKWVPREKTKFKWLSRLYAMEFSNISKYEYKNKNDAHCFFRKFISNHSYTCEQQLCAKNYDFIDSTEKNLEKYFYFFTSKQLQLDTFYKTKHITKYSHIIHNAFNPGAIMKTMFKLLNNDVHESSHIYDLLNKKWDQCINFYKKIFSPKDFIIFIDLSCKNFHNNNDVFYNILGMSYFLSHFSNKAYKRLFLCTNTPIWINLHKCDTLYATAIVLKQKLQYDCYTSCEIHLPIYLLMQSFFETQKGNIEDQTLVFMQGVHIESTFEYIYKLNLNPQKLVFWNFCDFLYFDNGLRNHLYNNKIQCLSGNNENALYSLWKDQNMFDQLLYKIKCN